MKHSCDYCNKSTKEVGPVWKTVRSILEDRRLYACKHCRKKIKMGLLDVPSILKVNKG